MWKDGVLFLGCSASRSIFISPTRKISSSNLQLLFLHHIHPPKSPWTLSSGHVVLSYECTYTRLLLEIFRNCMFRILSWEIKSYLERILPTLKDLFVFYVYGCFACICVYALYVHSAQTEAREGVRCGSWALNPGPLQEQPVLLTIEPSHKAPNYQFLKTGTESQWSGVADQKIMIYRPNMDHLLYCK